MGMPAVRPIDAPGGGWSGGGTAAQWHGSFNSLSGNISDF